MIDQQTDTVQAGWDRIADAYDTYVTPTHRSLAEEAVRRADVKAGERFLDVAAGSGSLGFAAALRGADVVATDLAPAMVRRLRDRAASAGLSNVETYVMDGHDLTLEDDTFDVAGSQFGVMLFPDMPKGIRELVRVTRPGGRVLMVVYGSPDEVDFLQFFVRAIRKVVPAFPGLPSDPPPLPLQLQDPRRLRHEMERAGLADLSVESTKERHVFRSGDELWQWLTNSNPIVDDIFAKVGVTDADRPTIRRALHTLIRERAGDGDGDEAVLLNTVHIGIGTKPA